MVHVRSCGDIAKSVALSVAVGVVFRGHVFGAPDQRVAIKQVKLSRKSVLEEESHKPQEVVISRTLQGLRQILLFDMPLILCSWHHEPLHHREQFRDAVPSPS